MLTGKFAKQHGLNSKLMERITTFVITTIVKVMVSGVAKNVMIVESSVLDEHCKKDMKEWLDTDVLLKRMMRCGRVEHFNDPKCLQAIQHPMVNVTFHVTDNDEDLGKVEKDAKSAHCADSQSCKKRELFAITITNRSKRDQWHERLV